MVIDAAFLRAAREQFNPYRGAGTEHMAPFLYSLIRMLRPRTVVEFGAGYTTFFILAALAENALDVGRERQQLRKKTVAAGDLDDLTRVASERLLAASWFSAGEEACGVDPAYYLEEHEPHLYTFDEQPAHSDYATRLARGVHNLGLGAFMTYVTGATARVDAFSPAALPIDLAWNDHRDYRAFFSAFWPALNPSGGVMIFHNTVALRELWDEIEWMKAERAAARDLEVLTVPEPHKVYQSSCSILRRTSTYQPPFLGKERRAQVLQDIRRFMSQHCGDHA